MEYPVIEAVSKSKLTRLDEIADGFEGRYDFRTINSYFIGALSVLVSDEVWDEALKSARNCALAQGLKLKGEQ